MIRGRRPSFPLAFLLLGMAAAAGYAIGQETGANETTTAAVQESAQVAEQAPEDRSSLTDPEAARLDAEAAEVAGQLRCLVCRNQSVLESNAELSREMQALIRERLAAGDTPDEVKAYFVSRYGEFILLQPQARGINLIVYALPGVVLLLGFFVARNRLKKWASSGARATAADGVEALAADDENWLRDALRED